MPGQKYSETIRQQKKARQEFLELKKMQNGELPAGTGIGEGKIVPKTPKEKIDNFWYQYKWYVVAIVVIVAIISVSVSQCVTTKKKDFEVVVFTYHAISDNQIQPLREYMEDLCEDINGDGEVNIQFVNCSYEKSDNNGQYEYTMLSKIQAVLAADYDALLYITDSDSYDYFSNMDGCEGLFDADPIPISNFVKNSITSYEDNSIIFPDNLQISCRTVSGTILDGKKNTDKVLKESQKIIENLKSQKKQ